MTSREIWRRRVVLMAVFGLLVAIPLTLLLRDGDGEEGGPSGSATSVPAPPPLGPAAEDSGIGVSYRVPEGWDESREASAIRLSSPDSSAEVVIAAPAPAADADVLLEETLDAFRTQYDEVEIAPGAGREVGGIEAQGAVVQATEGGEALRVLVAVAAGEKRAYLVEVFTTGDVSEESLREAQVALNSLELRD